MCAEKGEPSLDAGSPCAARRDQLWLTRLRDRSEKTWALACGRLFLSLIGTVTVRTDFWSVDQTVIRSATSTVLLERKPVKRCVLERWNNTRRPRLAR